MMLTPTSSCVVVRSEIDARDRFLSWGLQARLGEAFISESYGFQLKSGEWEFDVVVGNQVAIAFINPFGEVRAPMLNISKKCLTMKECEWRG